VVIARLGVFFVAGLAWFVWCCDSQAWRVFVVAGLAWFVLCRDGQARRAWCSGGGCLSCHPDG
jgi:hypothetical protein